MQTMGEHIWSTADALSFVHSLRIMQLHVMCLLTLFL